MKFSLLFLLGIILFSVANAKGLPSYYNQVNHAELAITRNDFAQASKEYQNAFSEIKDPFAKDLYNATMCGIMSKDTNQAFQLLQQLSEKGVGRAFFERNALLLRCLGNDSRWPSLLKNAEQYKEIWNAKTGPLQLKLRELEQKNEEMQNLWGNSDHSPEAKQQFKTTNISLVQELLQICQQYGFPSEQSTGVHVQNETYLSDPSFFNIILNNYIGDYSAGIRSDTLFSPLLKQAMDSGLVRPSTVASLLDHGSSDGRRPFYGTSGPYTIYRCSLYKQKFLNDPMLSYINASRNSLHLSTLQDYVQKMLYNAAHPRGEFYIDAHCDHTESFASEEAEKSFFEHVDTLITAIPDCRN